MKIVDMPRHIDDPTQYLFWEIDEVMVVVGLCAFGIAFEALITMFMVGLVAAYWLRRNKVTQLPGLTVHIAYWIGLTSLSRVFTNGAVRELVA